MRLNRISFVTIASLTLLTATPTLSFADRTPTSDRQTKSYSQTEIDTIMKLRERGEGLAQVAQAVGGNREDVKAAEAVEKRRQKAARASKASWMRSIFASR